LDAVPCQCHDGAEFVGGKPLFGKSKTVRGIVLAIFSSAVAAPLIWFDWAIGVAVGSAAMTGGDLFSSFLTSSPP
jgi:hypothetical protein